MKMLLKTIHPRHPDVRHDRLDGVALEELEGGRTVGGREDLVTGLVEQGGQQTSTPRNHRRPERASLVGGGAGPVPAPPACSPPERPRLTRPGLWPTMAADLWSVTRTSSSSGPASSAAPPRISSPGVARASSWSSAGPYPASSHERTGASSASRDAIRSRCRSCWRR